MDTGLKLLLLEDNPDDAELIQRLLKRSGMQFSAEVVSDEKGFLNALDENNFDAVLADTRCQSIRQRSLPARGPQI